MAEARKLAAHPQVLDEVIAAKEALPHGQFGPLLELLTLSPRMAQRFMAIASNPVLGDASRVTSLPAAIGTLDELTRWEPRWSQ